MLILNMYSMSKLYQYRIFPIARLLGPPTILYYSLIFPHARLFGTLLLLGTLEYTAKHVGIKSRSNYYYANPFAKFRFYGTRQPKRGC